MMTVIHNARIFDGTGTAPFAGHLVIEGNRIQRVAAGAPPGLRTRASA